MRAAGTAWTDARRARRRADYARNEATGHHINAGHSVTVPADVTVMERDPSPCGYCGVRGDVPCKHKPWTLAS